MQKIVCTILTVSCFVGSNAGFYQNRNSNEKAAALKLQLVKNGLPAQNFLLQRDPSYATLNVPWQLMPPPSTPLGFVVPRNEHDVQDIVVTATNIGLRIIAKGGGHSFEKFSYGDSNSVVIDLRLLNQIEVDPMTKRASVGPGVLVGPLSMRLWELAKVLTPTAYCPTVGIAGSTLGGGLGNFAAAYGLGLDNVLEMNVVNAKGQVMVVNRRMNSDLFWALRGAGASFGIVTKFVFRTYPAPEVVFTGILVYDMMMFPQAAFAYQNFLAAQPSRDNVTAELEVLSSSQFQIRFTDVTGTDRKFEFIRTLFPDTTTSIVRQPLAYPDYLVFQAGVSNDIIRNTTKLETPSDLALLTQSSAQPVYQYRKTFYVQKIVGMFFYAQIRDFLAQKPDTVSVWFEPYGGAVSAVEPTDTSFVHRGPTLYNACSSFKVIDSSDTEAIAVGRAAAQAWWDLGMRIFQHGESYQNYVDLEVPNYLERFYGTNLPRLIQIKKKYDPQNVFNNPQSVPTTF